MTYIFMLHVFEQSQLSVGSLCMDDGLERSGQLFHCYLQVRLHIKRRAERKVTCETGGLLTEKRKCITAGYQQLSHKKPKHFSN